MAFTTAQVEYLQSQRIGRLATKRADGTLQNNPVLYRLEVEAGVIDIRGNGMTNSAKFKNVLHNGQVAFVVDDLVSESPWKTRMIEIRGTAEALHDSELIRITPTRVITVGIE